MKNSMGLTRQDGGIATPLTKTLLVTLFITWLALFTAQAQGSEHHHSLADSLENVLSSGKRLTPEEKFNLYDDLSWEYLNIDGDMALDYAEQGLALSRKEKDENMRMRFLNRKGVALYMKGNYTDAEKCYRESLSLAEKRGDKDRELANYGALANMYQVMSRSALALENYLEALTIAEELGRKDHEALLLGNIGAMYMHMYNYAQAEKYFNKSVQICIETGDREEEAACYQGLANIAYLKDVNSSCAEAIQYAEKSLAIYTKLGNEFRQAHLYGTLAVFYNKRSEYEKAIALSKKALAINIRVGYPGYIFDDHKTLGYAYLGSGKIKEALYHTQQALAVLDTSFYKGRAGAYELAQSVYIALGDKEKIIAYSDSLGKVNSMILNKEIHETVCEMEIKYETEKKETRIASLEREKRLMLWLSFTGGGILILALAVFILLWRWTAQKRRFAESQKGWAEQQVKQLEQEKQLIATQAVLDGEIQERSRLSRDLHDGLGSMLTGVKFNLESMKNSMVIGSNEVKYFNNAMRILNDSMLEMRRVAHHLMPDTLFRFGLKASMSDFCDTLPAVSFSWYGEEIRLKTKMETMIYRTLCELINNALKHARPSQILVQIIQDSNRIAFTVQDDGCGFDTQSASDGLGLQNIRTRVAYFGGIMHINSKIGEGTEINVELKIEKHEQ